MIGGAAPSWPPPPTDSPRRPELRRPVLPPPRAPDPLLELLDAPWRLMTDHLKAKAASSHGPSTHGGTSETSRLSGGKKVMQSTTPRPRLSSPKTSHKGWLFMDSPRCRDAVVEVLAGPRAARQCLEERLAVAERARIRATVPHRQDGHGLKDPLEQVRARTLRAASARCRRHQRPTTASSHAALTARVPPPPITAQIATDQTAGPDVGAQGGEATVPVSRSTFRYVPFADVDPDLEHEEGATGVTRGVGGGGIVVFDRDDDVRPAVGETMALGTSGQLQRQPSVLRRRTLKQRFVVSPTRRRGRVITVDRRLGGLLLDEDLVAVIPFTLANPADGHVSLRFEVSDAVLYCRGTDTSDGEVRAVRVQVTGAADPLPESMASPAHGRLGSSTHPRDRDSCNVSTTPSITSLALSRGARGSSGGASSDTPPPPPRGAALVPRPPLLSPRAPLRVSTANVGGDVRMVLSLSESTNGCSALPRGGTDDAAMLDVAAFPLGPPVGLEYYHALRRHRGLEGHRPLLSLEVAADLLRDE